MSFSFFTGPVKFSLIREHHVRVEAPDGVEPLPNGIARGMKIKVLEPVNLADIDCSTDVASMPPLEDLSDVSVIDEEEKPIRELKVEIRQLKKSLVKARAKRRASKKSKAPVGPEVD